MWIFDLFRKRRRIDINARLKAPGVRVTLCFGSGVAVLTPRGWKAGPPQDPCFSRAALNPEGQNK